MGRPRKTDPQLCVGYLRKSTDKQELSFEAQRAGIERFATQHGLRVVAWFEDALSGLTPMAARPGLQAALESLRSTRAGTLLVLRRCRLGRPDRGRPVVAEIERELQRLNVRALDCEGHPAVDDADRADALDAVSASERRRISRRTKEALRALRARGCKTGGDAPYGFRAVDVPVPGGVVRELREDAAEQNVIAKIRELRAQRMSAAKIAAWLTERSFPCRGPRNATPEQRAAARWHTTTVALILKRAA